MAGEWPADAEPGRLIGGNHAHRERRTRAAHGRRGMLPAYMFEGHCDSVVPVPSLFCASAFPTLFKSRQSGTFHHVQIML
jgi:hypothetical protein